MNNQITYDDKVALNDNPLIPDINKCKADDMNEIKNKHNGCMNGSIPMGNIVVDSIQSKNLFNKNNVFIGIIYANGSIGSNETAYRYTEYIPITKNKITLSGINTSGGGNIIEYNSNKEKIDNWSTSNRTLTLNSNTRFIRFSLSSNDLDTAQLEYGESATPYSPFQDLNNQQVYSTSEVRIGTWIDGKPLYRKVYEISVSSPTSSVDTNISSLNMDTLVNIYGSTIQGTYKRNVFNTYAYSGTLSEWSGVFINGTTLTFRNYNLAVTKAYMILEYTKTTD